MSCMARSEWPIGGLASMAANGSFTAPTAATDDIAHTIEQPLAVLGSLPQQPSSEPEVAAVPQSGALVTLAMALIGRLPISAIVKSVANSLCRVPIGVPMHCNRRSRLVSDRTRSGPGSSAAWAHGGTQHRTVALDAHRRLWSPAPLSLPATCSSRTGADCVATRRSPTSKPGRFGASLMVDPRDP